MVEQEEIYALNVADPWVNFPDPGVHRTADGTLNSDEQRDAEVIFNANKKVFDSESNVRRAIIDGLNAAVPRQYKRSGGNSIGAKMYKANDCPRTILNNLRTCYGRLAPIEKTQNEARWSAPWNPSDPVEDLFDRLEECYIIALTAKPAYTQDQMIDKGLTAIQVTGLYSTAVLEWTGFDEANMTWAEFKSHMSEAYDIRLQSGAGAVNIYHGAANATDGADDDSLGSITQSLTNMHMAHNANAQQVADTCLRLRLRRENYGQ